jgi:hypothetical protein
VLSEKPQLRECFITCRLPGPGFALEDVTVEDAAGNPLVTWPMEVRTKGLGFCVWVYSLVWALPWRVSLWRTLLGMLLFSGPCGMCARRALWDPSLQGLGVSVISTGHEARMYKMKHLRMAIGQLVLSS